MNSSARAIHLYKDDSFQYLNFRSIIFINKSSTDSSILTEPSIKPRFASSRLKITTQTINYQKQLTNFKMASPLPRQLLIQTTHTKDGKSVFASPVHPPSFQPFGPSTTSFTTFNTTTTLPIPAPVLPQSFPNGPPTFPKCPPTGLVFASSDFAPGGKSPLHRTPTADYCIIISGEITSILAESPEDIGKGKAEERTLRAGDVFIQNGTNHVWENRGKEWARVLFCMVGAEKIVLPDGKTLGDTQPSFKK